MSSVAIKEMRKEVKKFVTCADEKVIKHFYEVMETQYKNDWWGNLPKKVKAEIEEALTDLDNGNGVPHNEEMKKYSKLFMRNS